jgi:hypothetical protein
MTSAKIAVSPSGGAVLIASLRRSITKLAISSSFRRDGPTIVARCVTERLTTFVA